MAEIRACLLGSSAAFQAGIPRSLFKTVLQVTALPWAVSADGSKFLLSSASGEESTQSPPFTVVLNWMAALKK
jgi:hypothetical protein